MDALLLTSDPHLAVQLQRLFGFIEIRTFHVGRTEEAIERIGRSKIDAAVVDLDIAEGDAFIRALRQSKANGHAIVFALTSGNGTNSHSFASGANFVIQKPLSPEHALRSLRAAHGLMLREHRRYIRCRIHLPCLIFHATGNVRAETFDISESGVGVHLPASAVERLAGAALRLQISLPGESIDLESAVQIAWAKPGRAGLRFTAMSTRCKNTLLGWLSRTLEG